MFPNNRGKAGPALIPVETPEALKADGGFFGIDGFAQPVFETRFLFGLKNDGVPL
jgi:hypothetical protein